MILVCLITQFLIFHTTIYGNEILVPPENPQYGLNIKYTMKFTHKGHVDVMKVDSGMLRNIKFDDRNLHYTFKWNDEIDVMTSARYNIRDSRYVDICPINIVIQDIVGNEFYFFVSNNPFSMEIKTITKKYQMVEREAPLPVLHQQGGKETLVISEIKVVIDFLNEKEPPHVAKKPFNESYSTSSTQRLNDEITNKTPGIITHEHKKKEKYSTQRSLRTTIKHGENKESSKQTFESSSHELSDSLDASIYTSQSTSLKESENQQSSTQTTTKNRSFQHGESNDVSPKSARLYSYKPSETTNTSSHSSQSTTLLESENKQPSTKLKITGSYKPSETTQASTKTSRNSTHRLGVKEEFTTQQTEIPTMESFEIQSSSRKSQSTSAIQYGAVILVIVSLVGFLAFKNRKRYPTVEERRQRLRY